MEKEYANVQQKVLHPMSGILMLIILILASIASVLGFVVGLATMHIGVVIICVLLWCILPFLFAGRGGRGGRLGESTGDYEGLRTVGRKNLY